MVSGKRAKAIRRQQREGMVSEIMMTHDLEQLDVWTDPETGNIYFAPKEDEDLGFSMHPDLSEIPEDYEYKIFPKSPEPEKEYPNDTRPVCTNCGKRQNETHYVPIQKASGRGGFFICEDNVQVVG